MLTKRELEVFKLVCKGYNNKEIGKILYISSHTAKAHVNSIINKLSVRNRTQAAYIGGTYLILKKNQG